MSDDIRETSYVVGWSDSLGAGGGWSIEKFTVGLDGLDTAEVEFVVNIDLPETVDLDTLDAAVESHGFRLNTFDDHETGGWFKRAYRLDSLEDGWFPITEGHPA